VCLKSFGKIRYRAEQECITGTDIEYCMKDGNTTILVENAVHGDRDNESHRQTADEAFTGLFLRGLCWRLRR